MSNFRVDSFGITVPIWQLIGYRGHGKDTLHQMLTTRNESNKELHWEVWGLPGTHLSDSLHVSSNIIRYAYADDLKYRICDQFYLNRQIVHNGFFDKIKDDSTYLFNGKTLRQHCLDQAKIIRRDEGDDCFVKIVLQKCSKQSEGVAMITDTRMKKEILDGTLKVRIYRKSGPVPPENEITEHDLDSQMTDFLLIEHTSDLDDMVKLNEGYSKFVYLEKLVWSKGENVRVRDSTN
jgi:hypothetical protein